MDYKSKSKEELEKILNSWCEAYEAGDPIVSDEEYDELAQYLQKENSANIGAKSKSEAYTVKHAFIMGSLDKVHAIKNDETEEINFAHPVYNESPKDVVILKEVNNALSKANNAHSAEFSPKLDGCSFSLTVQLAERGDCVHLSCATRGDGQFGIDILPHFLSSDAYKNFSKLEECAKKLLVGEYDTLVIRGEAIVRNSVYDAKYSERFKNPRVFVSGTLYREFDESAKDHAEHLEAIRDIDFICYDYRLVDSETQDYVELSWMNPGDKSYQLISDYLGNIGQLPDENARVIITKQNGIILSEADIETVYKFFEDVRKNSDYALDGIVVKPECSARQKNLSRPRPEDMIAIKFVPEKMSSVITDIVWTVSQNGECYPNGRIAPVKYDGKTITRVGLHGYSYLIENKCGIGSRVEMVMNGDIVPGVYKVLSEGTIKMPDYETYVDTIGDNDTLHLFKIFSEDDLCRHKFRASAKALQVDGVKEKTALKMWDMISEKYKELYHGNLANLMQLMMPEMDKLIYHCMGEGKAIINIVTSLDKYKKKMTFGDIIRGLCIEGCGASTSEVCAKILSGVEYDTTGLNESAYSWALIENSEQTIRANTIADILHVEKYKPEEKVTVSEGTQFVILTGSPASAGYATKKEWLNAHPQYVETTKWTECQLLVTNDLESKTGKMAKAAKLGIPVRTYED